MEPKKKNVYQTVLLLIYIALRDANMTISEISLSFFDLLRLIQG